MTKVVLISGAEAVKKFKKLGWMAERQKGSHVMMTKPSYLWTLSIPQHPEVGSGLLKKLLKQAGVSVEDFNKL